jgi:hypothetical protein
MSQDDQVRFENEEDEVEAHKHSTKAASEEPTEKTEGDDDFEAHRHTKGRPTVK